MGSGSNSLAVNVYCTCHPDSVRERAKLWEIHPGQGVEVSSRHHGTYHNGSMGVRDLLEQIAGTVSGSAILQFVQEAIGT